MESTPPPTFEDVENAARQIAGEAVHTPLLCNAALDRRCGRRVYLKPEMLQRSGSFKFRGAFNRISRLSGSERQAGIIAWSSGNHAQGIAAAASIVDARARIVMPADAPAIKRDNTRALGGEIISYDRYTEDREAISRELAVRDGAVLVPSYDDPFIIAGQGTAGLEICEDVKAQDDALDALFICCGGGGLSAGCALAVEALSPHTHVYCVEPEGYDDHARSLACGERLRADTTQPSLCDALLAPTPGAMTFEINRRLLHGGLVVSDAEVRDAMRYAFNVLKLVVEPGGAVALAVLLAGRIPPEYASIGIMLSGGNVDPALFASIIADS